MNTQQIAQTVRQLRKINKLTQKQLAMLAGVGKTAIFDIEKGKPSVQLDTLLKVFDILNIKIKLETPINLED